MSDRPEQLGYFAAMRGAFTGTAVFEKLIGQTPLRAAWHTVLTVLILAVFASAMQLPRYAAKVAAETGRFEAEFGGIEFVEPYLTLPQRAPETARSFPLEFGGLLVYTPIGKPPVLPEKSSFADYRYMIFWFPKYFVTVGPGGGEGKYAVNVFASGARWTRVEASPRICDAGELKKVLDDAAAQQTDLAPQENASKVAVSAADIARIAKVSLAVAFFLIFLFDAAGQILMCLLIFVGFFALTSGRGRTLRWGELVRIALYAGCPALLVAAVFVAFDLTGVLSFGTVYVIGTVGYFLVIVNKMEHARHAGQP